MRLATLIVAAGQGKRARESGAAQHPKQYRRIGGKAVLSHTLAAFKSYGEIVVVMHADHDDFIAQVRSDYGDSFRTVYGGSSRSESVKAGLAALADYAPNYVLVHDAARPFVNTAVIQGVIDTLSSVQACAPALPVVDAVKLSDGTEVDRTALNRMQTPQGFHYGALMSAYVGLGDNIDLPDDIAVAKAAGLTLAFSEGDADNIKLTYPEDFAAAEAKMSIWQTITVTGSGFDVHRLIPGDYMHLCGIKIEGNYALLGHSDADVGLHSITDAILGAIAMGDIGDHFPPSDPQWAGAASDKFLLHAVRLANAQGAKIIHVDLTLICEKPKVKPHREAMRARLSELLGLPLARVSVKATTTEGLGFTGRAEGIAAQAVVSVEVPA